MSLKIIINISVQSHTINYNIKKNKVYLFTFEQPGVNAPGTPNMMIFFPAAICAKFTLSFGVFSKRSTLGNLSPTLIKSDNVELFNVGIYHDSPFSSISCHNDATQF